MNKIKITKIIQVDETQYDVYLQNEQDEQEILIVSGDALVKNELLKPQEISMEMYQSLIRANNEANAFDRAVNFLSYRKRSIAEMHEYLENKLEVDESIAKGIIEKLINFDYLNDEDFIRSYTKDAILTSSHGPTKIKDKLERTFGCDLVLIDSVFIEVFDKKIQIKQIEKDLKKLLRKKYLSQFQAQQKISEKLTSDGHASIYYQPLLQKQISMVQIDEQKIDKLLEKTYQKQRKKVESDYELNQKMVQALATRQVDYSEAIEKVNLFLENNKNKT